MRCTAAALQSSRSVLPSVSTQWADEERRGCGTDVPEPSTVSFIIPTPFLW
jgi:hypothetical protein